MIMSAKYLLIALTVLAATPAVPQSAQGSAVASQQVIEQQLLGLIALSAAPLLPLVMVQDQPQQAAQKPAATRASQHEDEGERIFQQNCSRCHNAPEGFSPRISGTIVRHMRVRASLSKHDEEELLHFFNP
jgi:cytochrome c5